MKRFSLIVLIPIFILSACAVAGRYLIDLKYHPEANIQAKEGAKKRVVVYKFEDVRNVPQKNLLGQKVEPGKVEYEFMPMKGDIGASVAIGIAENLAKAGIKINSYPETAFDKDKLALKEGEIAVTGKISDMWIDAFSGFGKSIIKTKVKIEIFVYDVKGKNIIYQTSVESSSENTDLFFARDKAEKYINKTLATVIDRLLSGEEFMSKLSM